MFFLQGLTIPAIVGLIVGMLAGITVHEFSHALAADRLGDRRPRALGRVSLNPLRHLDPIGTALLVLVGIGWGKPVPVAVEALRTGRTGMAVVAAAGPIANIVVALIIAGVFRIIDIVGLGGPVALQLLYTAVAVNLLLAILNLIPIPPLDGFGVVISLVPPRWEYTIRPYAGYGVVLLLLLLIVPGSPLSAILGLAYPWAAILCGL
ncbi:MAG: site-2 protease family protein [Chloroflexi bacterium]|nr:MAG: site-2 protease family protein [Chloroflexota bacterium]